MADQVLDSWEDMIDENGVLDHKLNKLSLNESKEEEMASALRPIVANNCNSSVDSGGQSSVWLSNTSNDTNNRVYDNLNAIKILKRPVNREAINRESECLVNSGNDPNQNQTIITLEDNTRTQYVPQVRILKRQKDSTGQSPTNKPSNGNQTNSKTYEEREAEYAKARLRILGSASAPEEESNSSTTAGAVPVTSSGAQNSKTKTTPTTESRSTKLGLLNNCNELNAVPIIRLPLGPDGTKGFNRQTSPQHR
ncbi:unnamed protein product [Medioppia subpectinata]|uniref:SUZ RNA-binding domain-containing n=1 Tax=Medioppia subpectinata TaxID=1979941 RepID=A0A7R9Q4T0_9ACAR|nr:unnamed protein product [Medioppia subpectinata]CAG2112033.1 unnamed protein product [Medioppia subpectinata]